MGSDVYSMSPVNGTAGRIVGQKGCVDELTDSQIREQLVLKANKWADDVTLLRKGSPERKALGKKMAALHLEISKLKKFTPKKGFKA